MHVAAILDLGVENRNDAARTALSQGLVANAGLKPPAIAASWRRSTRNRSRSQYLAHAAAQATNLLVATALAWFMWPIVPQGLLLGWWAASSASCWSGWSWSSAIGADPPIRGSVWHSLMTAAAVLSGLVWGAAGVLFFYPESAAALIFLTIILAGMAAGSIASHSSWPPQFSGAILSMTPIGLRYLQEDGSLWVLGPICLLYLLNVLAFARQFYRTSSSRSACGSRSRCWCKIAGGDVRQEQARRGPKRPTWPSRNFAAASHDLRQPLHAVNLFIEALRNEKDPRPSRKGSGTSGGVGAIARGVAQRTARTSRSSKPGCSSRKPGRFPYRRFSTRWSTNSGRWPRRRASNWVLSPRA